MAELKPCLFCGSTRVYVLNVLEEQPECDFEEDLSLEEIKTLIEDKALNGVDINCMCHFADEKIGPRIEWDDDIDINYRDCTAETWEAYFNE